MAKTGREDEFVFEKLNQGMEIEVYGIRFYTKSAENTADPRGRQTLKYLAGEEQEHLKFINDLKKSFETRDKDTATDIARSRSAKEGHTQIFPKKAEFAETIKDDGTGKKILFEAVEIEKRSIQFYTEALNKVEKTLHKEIFTTLLNEEKGHLELVQQMSDYMTLHGVWSGLDDYFANE